MTAFLIFYGGNSIFINSFEIFISIQPLITRANAWHVGFSIFLEGREGVKWELGFAFLRDWEIGILCTGTGIHETKTIENGNGI